MRKDCGSCRHEDLEADEPPCDTCTQNRAIDRFNNWTAKGE